MVAALLPVEANQSEFYPVVVGGTEVDRDGTSESNLLWLTGQDSLDREALITRHLPLVRYVAGTMSRHANASSIIDYDDLVGYGTEGLIDAVDSYDPTFNVRFSTWAVMHIRTTIQDALRVLDPLSRSLRSKSKEIERVQYSLANTHGCWPADAAVAGELGISVDRLRHLQQDINRTVVSLENSTDANGDENGQGWIASLAETDPETDPESYLDAIEMRLILRQAVEALPERERLVVSLYYNQGQSMRTISERLGISESRVSQLHARILKLLRREMNRLLEVAV